MLPNSYVRLYVCLYVIQNLYERLFVRLFVLPNLHVHRHVCSSVLPKLVCALVCAPKLLWALVCPTPRTPSSLTLVPQSRLAFGHQRRVSWPWAFCPSAIIILSHHINNKESFLIETQALSLRVRPYANSSEFSYTTTLSYQSIELFIKKYNNGSTYERP